MTARRICVISYEYPPTGGYFGGIGTQYGALAPCWAAAGAEVHVVTARPPGKEVAPVIDGVHVHALTPARGLPWVAATWARRVRGAMRDLGPFDAVICPEFRGEASLYSDRQAEGPLVTHLLTSTAQLLALRPGLTAAERHGPRTRIFQSLERRQAERSQALFSAGEAVLQWARRLWPSIDGVPARILPLTIRVGEVRKLAADGELPPGFPAPGRRPLVALASRLDGHKGADALLEAMRQDLATDMRPFFEKWQQAKGALVPSKTRSDAIEQIKPDSKARTFADAAIECINCGVCYAACDVVAIPSLWESFCLAAVEAMALGVPVIGTRGHGFDEYLRDRENGLLVERRDVDALAEAVERLLDSPELRSALGAAAQLTADELDVPRVAPRYLQAFSAII